MSAGKLSLDGTWQLSWWDGMRGRRDYQTVNATERRRFIPARVPGEVHLDAQRAGWIADPYVGTNALAARWIEECWWLYRREFTAPPASRRGRAWLVFEGLDLNAIILLNGAQVGTHGNSFYPCRVDVTGKLKPGRNVLSVRIEAGLYGAADRPVAGYQHGEDQKLHKRHWLRKPQSQASWDWSTRLLNVGIHGSVRLEWTADPARLDALVPLAEVSADYGEGVVRSRLFVEGLGPKPVRGVLKAELPGTGISASVPVELKPGLHPVEATLRVPNPKLWWPRGFGPQDRYALRVSLTVGGRTVGERTSRFGFRRVRINQDPHPETGRYFTIEVNGQPVFCRGANLVPADMITAAIDRARYETLVARALEANFNFLRVWGGGLYEADDLYELCDREGILVWQEFIFACAKYPSDDEGFFEDVKREARHQIRRLACRPSLVVWCGNNEMEEGNWFWGYDRGKVMPDYALFHLTLPRLMAEEDPTRYYQPSSPYSPDGKMPRDAEVGDQHPWSVGFWNTDFRDYRKMVDRFPNEGGILGPTSLPTVKACLPPGQEFEGSLAWDIHENSIAFWEDHRLPDAMLEQWLGRSLKDLSLADWVYWGGVVQGEGFAEYIKNFRRRMFSSASAIFWMYNDCWPAVRSWTIVDHALRRTPSFHPVRRAFASPAVAVVREGDRVRIFGITDGPGWQGQLHYGLLALAGRYPFERRQDVRLAANASTLLADFAAAEWDRVGVKTHVAFARLLQDGGEVARDRLILPLFKEMRWPRATVRVRRRGGRVELNSRTFAWRVCLDLDGERELPDNFFDVWPGIPTVLPWSSRLGAPKVLRSGNGVIHNIIRFPGGRRGIL